MSLPGTSRRCIRAAGAAVNYIARIAGITSIIRIKCMKGAQKGTARPCLHRSGRFHRAAERRANSLAECGKLALIVNELCRTSACRTAVRLT
jgi:hypothetical protein